MEVIRNKKILALIGIVALLLGTFLPYITISLFGYSQSISLWGYWEGKVVLILTLANTLFIFQDWIEKILPQLFNNGIGKLVKKANNPKFSLLPTILVAAFAVYMLINIDVDSEYLKYGLGFYSLWIGVITLVGHAIFYKKQNVQPVQQPINNGFNQPQMQSQQLTNPQPINSDITQNNFNQQQEQQVNLQVQPMSNNNTVSNTKYCPNCGNVVDSNAQFCVNCGNKF